MPRSWVPALTFITVLAFLCISAGALREAWRLRRQTGLVSRGLLIQRASFGFYVPLMLGLLLAAGLLGPASPPLLLWLIFLATPIFVLAYFSGWLVCLLGRLRDGRGHYHPRRTVLSRLAPDRHLACATGCLERAAPDSPDPTPRFGLDVTPPAARAHPPDVTATWSLRSVEHTAPGGA